MNESKNINLKEVMGYARGQLIGKYGIAIAVAVLPTVLETLITTFSTNGNSNGALLISVLISIVVNLLIGVLILGQARVFLHIARGSKNPDMSDFFGNIKSNIDKAVMIQLPFTIASVISIVPAIMYRFGLIRVAEENLQLFELASTAFQLVLSIAVKAFFGMVFFILADHPDYDVETIYKKSIKMLEGNRLKFILIYIVNIPLAIVSFLACFVGVFWFMAYLNGLFANFYLLLNGEKPWSIQDELVLKNPENQNFDNDNNTY